MSKVSIAEAKNRLPRLIHEAEEGQPVQITRRGMPVAVILSEHEYNSLRAQKRRQTFMDAIEAMRADSNFEPVDLSEEEIGCWRQKDSGKNFSWDD